MLDIGVTVLLIILIAQMIYKLYREYQKSETVDKKVVFWIVLIIFAVPTIIYYLDRYNFISKFGWLENSSSDRWFGFFETYFSALVSSIIGAVALIIMTIHQLNLEREKDIGDKRVQNAPIFKYQIQNIHIQTDLKYIMLSNNEGNPYNLFIHIENLGLNHARNIEFLVTDVASKNSQKFRLDDMQSILKRDDSKWLQIMFNYTFDSKNLSTNNKQITILFSYNDLLNNKYNQELNLYLEVTSESGGQYGGYKLNIVSAEVKNEVQIKEEVK